MNLSNTFRVELSSLFQKIIQKLFKYSLFLKYLCQNLSFRTILNKLKYLNNYNSSIWNKDVFWKVSVTY